MRTLVPLPQNTRTHISAGKDRIKEKEESPLSQGKKRNTNTTKLTRKLISDRMRMILREEQGRRGQAKRTRHESIVLKKLKITVF